MFIMSNSTVEIKMAAVNKITDEQVSDNALIPRMHCFYAEVRLTILVEQVCGKRCDLNLQLNDTKLMKLVWKLLHVDMQLL